MYMPIHAIIVLILWQTILANMVSTADLLFNEWQCNTYLIQMFVLFWVFCIYNYYIQVL